MTREPECPSPEVVAKPSIIRTLDTQSVPAASRNTDHSHNDYEEEHEEEKGGMGTAMGVLIPFGLVFLAVGWVMYAYRNPHTKSGQFLIQVRDFKII